MSIRFLVYTSKPTLPVVVDRELTVSNVTTSGFDVSFNKATDDISAQSALVYKLYIANYIPNDIDGPISLIEANASLADSGTDVSTLSVGSVSEGDDIYFNVIVEDEAGNKTLYKSGFQEIPDETSPTVGTSTLSTSSVQDNSFNVDFTAATDNVDVGDELTYKLYTSSTNNLTTDASTVESNGTLQDTGIGVTQLSATGLTQATTYYFNIVVSDTSGNKSIYTSNSQLTTGTPADSTDPTLPGDTSLSTSSIAGSGWTVSFNKSTDDTSAQSSLVYKLYTSDTNNLDTDASTVISNGTLADQGTDVTSLDVTGLNEDVTKYFNVIVEDEAGNQSIYTQNSETTVDVTDPTVSDGSLSTLNVGSGSFNATYTKATDNVSAQSALTYTLYTSTTSNIDTVSNAEANGTMQQSSTDAATLLATGLNSDTVYYFNVVVEDEAGNKSAYTMNSQRTADLSVVNYNMDFSLEEITV